MPTLVEARELSSGYTGQAVVRELDLKVESGQVVVLLGPNGAGKTTTLLTLAGEISPLGGSVEFYGSPARKGLHRRAGGGMSFVTEERSVFMDLSVEENLRVGRCDVDEVVALFPELKVLLKRRAGLLSGGEQQMVTLGRALARKPRVLLIDELSLGLAPLVVTRLLNAVRQAADETGIGVLLVEQHVDQAMKIADYVYVMQRGRIVLHGQASDVSSRVKEIEASYLEASSESRAQKDATTAGAGETAADAGDQGRVVTEQEQVS